MPVPKRKRSRSRKNSRNANKGIAVQAFTYCKNCNEVLKPHSACKACGHYKGVKVIVTKTERALKRGESKKAKQAAKAVAQPAEMPAEESAKDE